MAFNGISLEFCSLARQIVKPLQFLQLYLFIGSSVPRYVSAVMLDMVCVWFTGGGGRGELAGFAVVMCSAAVKANLQ